MGWLAFTSSTLYFEWSLCTWQYPIMVLYALLLFISTVIFVEIGWMLFKKLDAILNPPLGVIEFVILPLRNPTGASRRMKEARDSKHLRKRGIPQDSEFDGIGYRIYIKRSWRVEQVAEALRRQHQIVIPRCVTFAIGNRYLRPNATISSCVPTASDRLKLLLPTSVEVPELRASWSSVTLHAWSQTWNVASGLKIRLVSAFISLAKDFGASRSSINIPLSSNSVAVLNPPATNPATPPRYGTLTSQLQPSPPFFAPHAVFGLRCGIDVVEQGLACFQISVEVGGNSSSVTAWVDAFSTLDTVLLDVEEKLGDRAGVMRDCSFKFGRIPLNFGIRLLDYGITRDAVIIVTPRMRGGGVGGGDGSTSSGKRRRENVELERDDSAANTASTSATPAIRRSKRLAKVPSSSTPQISNDTSNSFSNSPSTSTSTSSTTTAFESSSSSAPPAAKRLRSQADSNTINSPSMFVKQLLSPSEPLLSSTTETATGRFTAEQKGKGKADSSRDGNGDVDDDEEPLGGDEDDGCLFETTEGDGDHESEGDADDMDEEAEEYGDDDNYEEEMDELLKNHSEEGQLEDLLNTLAVEGKKKKKGRDSRDPPENDETFLDTNSISTVKYINVLKLIRAQANSRLLYWQISRLRKERVENMDLNEMVKWLKNFIGPGVDQFVRTGGVDGLEVMDRSDTRKVFYLKIAWSPTLKKFVWYVGKTTCQEGMKGRISGHESRWTIRNKPSPNQKKIFYGPDGVCRNLDDLTKFDTKFYLLGLIHDEMDDDFIAIFESFFMELFGTWQGRLCVNYRASTGEWKEVVGKLNEGAVPSNVAHPLAFWIGDAIVMRMKYESIVGAGWPLRTSRKNSTNSWIISLPRYNYSYRYQRKLCLTLPRGFKSTFSLLKVDPFSLKVTFASPGGPDYNHLDGQSGNKREFVLDEWLRSFLELFKMGGPFYRLVKSELRLNQVNVDLWLKKPVILKTEGGINYAAFREGRVYECGMEIRETSGGQLLGAGSLLNLDRLWFKKDFMSDISDGFNRMSCYLKLVTSPVPTVWTAIRLLSGEMPTEHDWFILNDQTCGKAGLFDMKNKLLQEEIAWLKQQSDAKHQGTIVKLEALLLSDEYTDGRLGDACKVKVNHPYEDGVIPASIYFGLDKKNKIVAQPRIAFRHKMKELAFSIGHVVDYLKQNELPDLKHWKDGSSGTAGRSELIINREAKELRIRLTNAKEISVVPDKVDGEAKRLEKQRVRSDGIVVAFFSDLGEVKQ